MIGIGRKLRQFIGDEQGSFSIEYVLWIPLIMTIIVLTFDVTLTFNGVARMWDIARDTARRVATEEMTVAEGKAYAESVFTTSGTYTVSIDDSTDNVIVTISASDVSPAIGALDYVAPGLMQSTFIMRKDAFSSDLGGGESLTKADLIQDPSLSE